ncbi:anaphase-promoting complex subunit 10 [Nannizzia gypsea CBS 118893]|uniref:Anaphase-promoting complex subunit 10 n=1 Tax=Arthroderma gypseum (strain ATCC MYA-4604 / CBS 118893) TaxID=535722 RepID=E4V299_ARTGP|nr:anaphase-promoting complex subunit 10 [Nannizzia gypsea CBS 118893]EFR04164.1 anaphase-promoting complex subunit 10 [Nannizzia gypsea CBS 118893]
MPRRTTHYAPTFPSGDGASVSTARVPQLLPSYTPQQRGRGQQPVTLGSDREDELDEGEGEGDGDEQEEEEDEEEEEQEDEDDDDEEGEQDELEAVEGQSYEEDLEEEKESSAPIPPNLREISSLASWTVSTYKPGSGVAALRHPSSNQFWQSDGPQPHTLCLHFFKRVSIVRIRVYLDFELDESYTPTKMIFLAGMGGNDLVEFATWQGETPCGWVDINLDGVGGRHQKLGKLPAREERRKSYAAANRSGDSDVSAPEDDSDEDTHDLDDDDGDDPSDGNVLKLMVLQVKVCENHQNGKDTHVRGFQVFARDDKYYARVGRGDNGQKLLHHDLGASVLHSDDAEQDAENAPKFDEEDWMMEPELR